MLYDESCNTSDQAYCTSAISHDQLQSSHLHDKWPNSRVLNSKSKNIPPELPVEGSDSLLAVGKDRARKKVISIGHHQKIRRKKDEQDGQELVLSGGFVRRLAAKNAMACVNALLEPSGKKKMKDKAYCDTTADTGYSDLKNTDMHWVDASTHSGLSGCLGKRKNGEKNGHGVGDGLNKRRKVLPKGKSDKQQLFLSESFRKSASSFSSDSVSTTESDSESIESLSSSQSLQHQKRENLECLDTIPYNLLGILYNGNCMHSNARFFSPEMEVAGLTNRIIPKVVPSNKEEILPFKENMLKMEHQKQRSQKVYT